MSKGIKGFGPPYKGRPMYGDAVDMEPKGISVKSLARKILGFLALPIVIVLTSVFMTVLDFMSMKAKAGESWGTLISWWWSLMVQDPLITMAFPVCIGMLFILFNPWSK